ncbi:MULTISPECIES: hypothetical protein [unclassified Arthrobacter]|uniref:hypothetical protein n=1 Tax=unclassified Arthrobacter TaxID=235627 RepID=UPI001E5C9C72|nr:MULTISPECIES: hypothetical protein [unclassified Arthrobacter]
MTHYKPRNRVASLHVKALMKDAESIREGYQGLDVVRLIEHAEKAEPEAPTFKEITALIRAAHRLIQDLDEKLIDGMDMDAYLQQLIVGYVRAEDVDDQVKRSGTRITRVQNIWGKQDSTASDGRQSSRRASALIQVGLNGGMAPVRDGDSNGTSVQLLDELVILSPAEVFKRFVEIDEVGE